MTGALVAVAAGAARAVQAARESGEARMGTKPAREEAKGDLRSRWSGWYI